MRMILRAAIGITLALGAAGAAQAQCTGQFPNNTVCGYTGGSTKGLPGPVVINPGVLNPIAGGTVIGNPTAASAVPQATTHPILGIPGASTGQQGFAGLTSGTATVKAQDAAGSPVLLLPNTSGTIPSTVLAPLALDAATGKASITGQAGGVLAGAGAAFTPTPVLGVPGTVAGSLGFGGLTSGTMTLAPQAAAGTGTLTLPNTAGTLAASASAPLVLNLTTGTLTCPSCVTSSGGGAITGTAPISVSGAGVVSLATPVALNFGGTHADLSATGGASQVLKQTSAGANVTVGQLAASDLSNGVSGSGAVALANTPHFVTPDIGAATGTSINLSGTGLFGGLATFSAGGTFNGLATFNTGTTIASGQTITLQDGRGATFDANLSQTQSSPNTWLNLDSHGGAGGWIGGVRIRASESGGSLVDILDAVPEGVTINASFQSTLNPGGLHLKSPGVGPGVSFEDTVATGSHRNFSVTNGFNANGRLEFLYGTSAGAAPTNTALAIDGTTGVVNFPIGPTAPTAAVGTNTTQLATTAFVLANGSSAGTTIFYDTRALAQAASIPAADQTVTLQGFYAVGDGGQGASYTRTGAACTTLDRFADASGQCWQLIINSFAYPDWVGATVNNSAHDAGAAIQALYTAGISTVILRGGSYWVSSGFALGVNKTLISYGKGSLLRNFNGDMITGFDEGAVIDGIQIEGLGVLTGRMIACTTGSHQRISNSRFADSVDYVFEATTGGACAELYVDNVQASRHVITNYAFKLPTTEALTTGFRFFQKVTGGGTALIDLAGSNLTFMNDIDTTGLAWSANTHFAKITNSRLAFGPVIDGTDNIIETTTISTNLVVNGTATRFLLCDGAIAGNITLNSGATSNIICPTMTLNGTGLAVIDNSGNGTNFYVGKYGPNTTVSGLPACGIASEGLRSFVTDGVSPVFYNSVSGGGSLASPVFCNGSAWVYGMNDNDNLERKAA